jgi:hypothetical protein
MQKLLTDFAKLPELWGGRLSGRNRVRHPNSEIDHQDEQY